MGLAYNLETTLNPYLGEGLSKYFVQIPQDIQTGKIDPAGDFEKGVDFFTPNETRGNIGDFNNGWIYRWCGKKGSAKQECQSIFPTGEYLIRDITFVNGYYAIVGAYKATFLDLYGVGSHGVAWDGFLFMYRGFSDNALIPFGRDGTPNYTTEGAASGAGILPMRMPYDILPSTNSATTEAMDDVGLFAVDILRGTNENGIAPAPGGGNDADAYSICLWLGGTQGIARPVTQGIPYVNVNRIAFGMAGIFGCPYFPNTGGSGDNKNVRGPFFQNSPIGIVNEAATVTGSGIAPYKTVGGEAGYTQFSVRANQTIKMAWNATANDTLYGGAAQGTATSDDMKWRLADIEEICSVGANERGGTGGAYQYEFYKNGWLPDGTNVCTGDTSADETRASVWGYYPKKFVDIQGYSSQISRFGLNTEEVITPALFGGDVWVGTSNPTGLLPTAKSYPMIGQMAWDIFGVATRNLPPLPGECGSTVQAPYMSIQSAELSYTGINTGFALEPSFKLPTKVINLVKTDALVANWNSLENSYVAFVTAPFEQVGNDYFSGIGNNPSGRQPLFYAFLNGIKYADSTIGTGIFSSDENPFGEGSFWNPFAFNGLRLDNFTTDTIPIDMANKWTAKCVQTRTFTTTEEERAKNLAPILAFDPIEPIITSETLTVQNSRNGEAVGVRNNYPRLGLEPQGDEYNPGLNEENQQGATTGEAVGAMGWKNVAGGFAPVVFVADSGGGWIKGPSFPITSPNYATAPTYLNAFQNRGNTFNTKIADAPNSNTRMALGASWDNDRDQWIFLFSNFSAVVDDDYTSVVSVTSTFTDTARYGSAYLDQTKRFGSSPTEYNNAIWKSFPMTNNLDGIVIFGVTNPSLPFDFSDTGSLGYATNTQHDAPQQIYAKPTTAGGTMTLPTQSVGCAAGTDPATVSYNPSTISVFNIDGSTGREAFVWVDYVLFDGADAVIATKLRERGMKVTIDAVEWFKRKIINSGDLNIKQEEIELWMRQQQDEFQMMMRDAERMGRVRKRKKQVSAYGLDILEVLNTDFEDKEVQEFMKNYLPQSRPPTPEEEMLERQTKGGYSPQAKSYFDEVFED